MTTKSTSVRRWNQEETAIMHFLVKKGFTAKQIVENLHPMGFLQNRTILSVQCKMGEITKALRNNKSGDPLTQSKMDFIKESVRKIKIPVQIYHLVPSSVIPQPVAITKTSVAGIAQPQSQPELNNPVTQEIVDDKKSRKQDTATLELMILQNPNSKKIRRTLKMLKKIKATEVGINFETNEIYAKL
jgi:hypothetical protein